MVVKLIVRDKELKQEHVFEPENVIAELGGLMMQIEEDEGRAYHPAEVMNNETSRFEVVWHEFKG